VDAFNVFLVRAHQRSCGFTTAVFRPGVHARRAGRVASFERAACACTTACTRCSPSHMLVALLTNNVGICGGGGRMEASTDLTTVAAGEPVMVRPPASEAAWKYFILWRCGMARSPCSGRILLYLPEKVLGAGGTAAALAHLEEVKGSSSAHGAVHRLRVSSGGLRHKVGLGPLA